MPHRLLPIAALLLTLSTPARSAPYATFGIGLEGPMLAALVAGVRFNDKLAVRLLTDGSSFTENLQGQLLYYWSPDKPHYLLFAAGDVSREKYLRFAVGRNWDYGNFRVNGSLGLNLLDFDDEGVSDLVNRIAAFQIFGLGVHYVF